MVIMMPHTEVMVLLLMIHMELIQTIPDPQSLKKDKRYEQHIQQHDQF